MLIVGLGQIGGSIGLDLVAGRVVGEVIGYDRKKAEVAAARRRHGVDSVAPSLSDGVKEADLVILAVPINRIIELLPTICRELRDDSAILDVGSTKSAIMQSASRTGARLNFVGGHPIAGNEGRGFDSARKGQFANATFVLVPSRSVTTRWMITIRQLVKKIGASPLVLTAREHDRMAALTIGLPYSLSLALMALAARAGGGDPKLWKMVGGSFRGATRVSASSPDLILQMFLSNGPHLVAAIDRMTKRLSGIRNAVAQRDERALSRIISEAQSTRRSQNPKT